MDGKSNLIKCPPDGRGRCESVACIPSEAAAAWLSRPKNPQKIWNNMENPWKTDDFKVIFLPESKGFPGVPGLPRGNGLQISTFCGPPIQFPRRWSWPRRTSHEVVPPPESSTLNFRFRLGVGSSDKSSAGQAKKMCLKQEVVGCQTPKHKPLGAKVQSTLCGRRCGTGLVLSSATGQLRFLGISREGIRTSSPCPVPAVAAKHRRKKTCDMARRRNPVSLAGFSLATQHD